MTINTEKETLIGWVRFFKCLLNYLRWKGYFVEFDLSDSIIKPIRITPGCVKLGKNVLIFFHARIDGVFKYNDEFFTPSIIIKDNVHIQQNLHLTCARSIIIGDNTAIAANVTITDINHPYTDINLPIDRQNIEVRPVKIGSDCKLYNNCVILPGTQIGNHVTIGANSVVSGVIPDLCVVAGVPGRIVKKYNLKSGLWEKPLS